MKIFQMKSNKKVKKQKLKTAILLVAKSLEKVLMLEIKTISFITISLILK